MGNAGFQAAGQGEEVVSHDGQRDRQSDVPRRPEERLTEEAPVRHPVPGEDPLPDERPEQRKVIRCGQRRIRSRPSRAIIAWARSKYSDGL